MKTSFAPNRVSLPRALSKLGLASRSQAERLIAESKVKVNGRVELNPHRWVNLVNDTITVGATKAIPQRKQYLLFNKPAGVVTTSADERGRQTVFDVIGDRSKGLIPVGRLDKETSGLMLLTSDHRLAEVLTNPSSRIEKTYVAVADRPIGQRHLDEMERGLDIAVEGKVYTTKPSRCRLLGARTVEIVISEGKNRQIRKMFEAVGFLVVELSRVSLGPLTLGSLKPGQRRDLNEDEVAALESIAAPGGKRRPPKRTFLKSKARP